MEENRDEIVETQETGYTPRPKWQIVCAWIGIVIMVISVILYYHYIANGGVL